MRAFCSHVHDAARTRPARGQPVAFFASTRSYLKSFALSASFLLSVATLGMVATTMTAEPAGASGTACPGSVSPPWVRIQATGSTIFLPQSGDAPDTKYLVCGSAGGDVITTLGTYTGTAIIYGGDGGDIINVCNGTDTVY